jgi:molybdopterin/thiamine biosynthesis adenylyltransferase
MLSDTQVERYSRQIVLPQVGGRGQMALLSATVTIGGSNALATTAALYLAAAGVGSLRVSPPTAAAIEGLNPDCCVVPCALDVKRDAAAAVSGATVVLWAGTNAATGALLNASCITARVPLICGAATDTAAWMSTCAGFDIDAPCFACLASRVGTWRRQDAAWLGGIAAGWIGTLLATEATKAVLGIGPSYVGRLLMYDALAGDVCEQPVRKDPGCVVCGGAG